MKQFIIKLYQNENIEIKYRLYFLFLLYTSFGREIRATNKHLGGKLGCTSRTIQRSLNWLKNAKLIDIRVFNDIRVIYLISSFEDIRKNIDIPDFDWLGGDIE